MALIKKIQSQPLIPGSFTWLLAIFLVIGMGCEKEQGANTSPNASDNSSQNHRHSASKDHNSEYSVVFPFDLRRPDTLLELTSELVEISGLTTLSEGELAAVEDESGLIYFLDSKTGRVRRKLRFGKDGDYEGIELVGRKLWITNSKGTLSRVANYRKGKPIVNQFNTPLKKRNNVEGLGFDPDSRKLLLALKGSPALESAEDDYKAVYRFDIQSNRLEETPVLILSLDSILSQDSLPAGFRKVFGEPKPGPFPLKPSGIAVDPVSGYWYILHNVGKSLLVYDQEICKMAVSIPDSLFPKPEGICFTPEGNLYIASEGKGGPGRLMFFQRLK